MPLLIVVCFGSSMTGWACDEDIVMRGRGLDICVQVKGNSASQHNTRLWGFYWLLWYCNSCRKTLPNFPSSGEVYYILWERPSCRKCDTLRIITRIIVESTNIMPRSAMHFFFVNTRTKKSPPITLSCDSMVVWYDGGIWYGFEMQSVEDYKGQEVAA